MQLPMYKYNTVLPKEKIIDNPTLQHVFIRLNNLCNATCEFCDVWKTKKEDFHKDIDAQQLIEEIIELTPTEVNLHGGEVFLSKVFREMLVAANRRLNFSITTNGRALNTKNIEFIYEHNVKRAYISIDHYDALKNSESRGIKWLGDNLFGAISEIKEKTNIEIIINHVVSSYNIDSIEHLISKMRELEVDSLNLIPIKDYPMLYVKKEQIIGYNHKIDQLLSQSKNLISFFMNENPFIFGKDAAQIEKAEVGVYNSNSKKCCIVPMAVMFIDAVTGNVYPCDTTMYRKNPEQYVLGNVLQSSLKEIWTGVHYQNFRKKMFPKITCDCINGCDPANVIR